MAHLELHKGRWDFPFITLDFDMTWTERREPLLDIPY